MELHIKDYLIFTLVQKNRFALLKNLFNILNKITGEEKMYKRPIYQKIMQRMEEPRAFMQVLAGPRQVGKSTLADQVKESLSFPSHYASADGNSLPDSAWIEEQWELGRLCAKKVKNNQSALLILDEIQKIPNWSDIVNTDRDNCTSSQQTFGMCNNNTSFSPSQRRTFTNLIA